MQIAKQTPPEVLFLMQELEHVWLFTSAKVVKTTNPQLMQARLQKNNN
jgi:hypothetical protein